MRAPNTLQRQQAQRRGYRAEWLAMALLILKGYRVLAHRAKTPLGEVDIVAKRGRTLAFVEVKHRADQQTAFDALTPRQLGRIARAAEWWLARHPAFAQEERRFDVVVVSKAFWPRHYPGIF